MKKTVRILAWVAGIVLGLLVVLVLVLPLVFDPNRYKGEIVQAVKTATGRELKIEGKIGWSLFPRLGISTERLELSNAPGFGREPFARVEAAAVRVEVLPLLSGRVHVDTIAIDGLTLNLAKNAAGRSNWDDLTAPRGAKTPAPEKAPSGGAPPLAAIAAGKLEIRKSTLTWSDQASGERYAVRNLTLSTGRLAVNEPVDVKLDLELEHGAPAKRTPLNLHFQAIYNADNLALKPFELRVDDSRLTGALEIRDFAHPAYRFDLALDQLDLDKYLPPAPAKDKSQKTAATPASAPVAIPLSLLRALNVQGKFAVGKLKAFGIRSEDIRTQISADRGLLQFGPNSAKLYSGTYNGRTALDVRGKTPQLKMEEQLTKVQLGPMLKDMGIFDKFSGEAELKLGLTAQGLDAAQIKRTLNGNVAVAARNGKIEGVNLVKLIADAKQLRDKLRGKSVTVTAAPSDETAFSSLTATIAVTNGVANNNDLQLQGPVVRATGKGSANLVTEELNYRMPVTVAESSTDKGSTVPVLISGTFAKPSFSVDFGEVIKQEADKAIKKELNQQLEKLFKKK